MTRPTCIIFGLILLLAGPIGAARAAAKPAGFDAGRHMTVDEVRPGMRGYGLSVFHGVKIEPFPVEVVSVQHGFVPGQSVVWIRCTGERMQKTGPVQGMSGSPIFLWDDEAADAKREIGQGGRLIGAFAFGHRLGKDCYIGVQPIEYMLDAATRAKVNPDADKAAAATSANHHLKASFALARDLHLDANATWRLRAIAKILEYEPNDAAVEAPGDARPTRMALPVTVGSATQARLLAPWFEAHGLRAAFADGVSASAGPPKWLDPSHVQIEQGSAFAVPLTFGAMDMSAIGTATDVLDDGTVVAFGHAMFAQGDIAVPMAVGYVHFVQPNLSASFKLGGTLRVTGAMVRDENAAVVGKPQGKFQTAEVVARITWPDNRAAQIYKYQVVHHRQLMPGLIAAVASQSLESKTALPQLNTLRIRGAMTFADGRTLNIDQVLPAASVEQLGQTVAMPIGPLTDSPFGRRELKRVELDVRVDDHLDAAEMMGVTVEKTTLRPGDTVVAHIRLQRFYGESQLKRLEVKLPADLPEGQYALFIGGGQSHYQKQVLMRPHLATAENADEVFDAVQRVMKVRDDVLYASRRLQPEHNLALGRTELPRLPSSRAALLTAPGSTRTTEYVQSIDVETPMPYVVVGEAAIQINVSENPQ